MYVSPGTVWFAAIAAVVTLAGAVWTCTLPLGAEADHDHGHDHGSGGNRHPLAIAGGIVAGVLSGLVVLAGLVFPPASLSAELAMQRATEDVALFAGADDVTLGVSDTTTFGVGDWASVFATSARPEAYDGSTVTLSGFVTPEDGGGAALTRMIITHCVIDARPASVPVQDLADLPTGQWVEVTGTVRSEDDGSLRIEPENVKKIAEPKDPYEY